MNVLKLIFSRITITLLVIGVQLFWLLFFWVRLSNYSTVVSIIFHIISIAIVLYIVKKDDNQSYKIPWIILILLVPIVGGLLYVFFGTKRPQKKMVRKIKAEHDRIIKYYEPNIEVEKEIALQNKNRAGLVSYLQNSCNFPVCNNTHTEYYPLGEDMYKGMLQELKKAENFIFLEYFIIDKGEMWDGIHEILKEKVAEGVDVRVIYDDIGCLPLLPANFDKLLEAEGIKCLKFNPFVPFLSVIMNTRDHRKILVIDGKVAFNGGINIADEYINKKGVNGHWKDTGVKLYGNGVNNFTVMFLEMWNAFKPTDEDYGKFIIKDFPECLGAEGYVLPFGDSPIAGDSVGQNVYLNIINSSNDYVYIFTPYLIIDDEMRNALCNAAKRGVDVRLITPGIGDKNFVHNTTRSYYPYFISNGVKIYEYTPGVKIYEYTPGFMHAKSYVSDDDIGVVGTINMDFRSLYLHFECGTLLYKTKAVKDLKEDFLNILPECQEIGEDTFKRSYLRNAIIRVFAPLM